MSAYRKYQRDSSGISLTEKRGRADIRRLIQLGINLTDHILIVGEMNDLLRKLANAYLEQLDRVRK